MKTRQVLKEHLYFDQLVGLLQGEWRKPLTKFLLRHWNMKVRAVTLTVNNHSNSNRSDIRTCRRILYVCAKGEQANGYNMNYAKNKRKVLLTSTLSIYLSVIHIYTYIHIYNCIYIYIANYYSCLPKNCSFHQTNIVLIIMGVTTVSISKIWWKETKWKQYIAKFDAHCVLQCEHFRVAKRENFDSWNLQG